MKNEIRTTFHPRFFYVISLSIRDAEKGTASAMQRDREARENFNTSRSMFDGFGSRGSMFPSIFGQKDPFDDPFFTSPFGSFGSNMFSSSSPANSQQTRRTKGPVIEELDSDDEGVPEGEDEDDVNDAAWKNRNPLVEHPEDQGKVQEKNTSNRREISHITNHNKVEATKPETRSVSYQRVTYGGINGAYYTATTSRRSGNDGATIEERKQADRTTGQATHRVSRGIHDKGHSVTRELGSDGQVDTMQTLHNLNEDELAGFEQAWKGNTDRHPHGLNDTFDFPGNSGQLASWGGFLDPYREHSNGVHRAQSSGGRPKKVVTINIE